MAIVKVCENNYGYGTNDIIEKIKAQRPDIEVEVASCWGYCDDCASGPYVFVHDKIVEANTLEALYDKILEAL